MPKSNNILHLPSHSITGSLLARNTLLNFIGQAVPLLVGVITIPFIIRGLGTERFGLLSLAWVGGRVWRQIMDNWPKVAIVVLNWNGWQDTIESLGSVQRLAAVLNKAG